LSTISRGGKNRRGQFLERDISVQLALIELIDVEKLAVKMTK